MFAHKSSTVAFPASDETRASGGGVVVVAGMGLTLLGAGRQEVVGGPVKSEAAPPPSEDAVRTLLPPLTPPAARRATVPEGAWLRASDPGSYPLFASATPRKKRLGRREMRCKSFFVRRRGVRECPASIGSPLFPRRCAPLLLMMWDGGAAKGGCVGVVCRRCLLFVQGGGRKKTTPRTKMSWVGCMGSGARSLGRSVADR